MSLLDACPNHRMSEVEIYHTFYEGMNKETKDLANSSTRGGFPQLRVSKAKEVLGYLLSAKRAYDNPRDSYSRKGVASASSTEKEDKLETRMDKLENELLTAIEKHAPPSPTENQQVTEPRCQDPSYNQPEDLDNMAHVNAAGHWNPNGSWNPGKQQDAPWREHPNFRWGDGNQNQTHNHSQNQYNPHKIRTPTVDLQTRVPRMYRPSRGTIKTIRIKTPNLQTTPPKTTRTILTSTVTTR